MKRLISLTGDRPTGHLHLGHLAGSIQKRLELQSTTNQFIMIADFQALTHNKSRIGFLNENIISVMIDYLSCGLDLNQNTFFVQSSVPGLHEVAAYFTNLVNMSRLLRNPTLKEELRNKCMSADGATVSFMCHPISQAADILAFDADLVPVGEDQKPIIEQTNEIACEFNELYGNVFKKVKVEYTNTPRLPGIDGQAKASKSMNNAIFLKDSSEEVRQKVFKMYTDPGHICANDAGRVEGNVVFSYMDAFHSDQNRVQELKAKYQKGGLGDVEIKKELYTELEKVLEPIRTRRNQVQKQIVYDALRKGNMAANVLVSQKICEMRSAMNLWN